MIPLGWIFAGLASAAALAILLPILLIEIPDATGLSPASRVGVDEAPTPGSASAANPRGPNAPSREQASPSADAPPSDTVRDTDDAAIAEPPPRRLATLETDRPTRQPTILAPAPASDPDEPALDLNATTPPLEQLDRSATAREQRVQRFGGTRRTEDAVEAGIAWLVAHQGANGLWNRFEFSRHCPETDRCPGAAVHWKQDRIRTGLTGLVTLALLGAGYTDREGPYQDSVGRAIAALVRSQGADGNFAGSDETAGYNNALATFALAEAYALTRDERLVAPLNRAVSRLVLSQQPEGGWDYHARNDSGRNDTSITGWVIQALHACAAAGIHVPKRSLARAALYLQHMTEADGRVRYADTGNGVAAAADGITPVYRYGPAMVGVGLTSRQLLGWRLDSPSVRRQRALLLAEPPATAMLQGGDPSQLHSYYYWYYGTIAMFQSGGEQWDRWNGVLRDEILPLQDRRLQEGERTHQFGSWPPFGPRWGKWGRIGGRVYTTALCVLTLEIYYRHTPTYLQAETVLTANDWRRMIKTRPPSERLLAAHVLGDCRLEVGEAALVQMLQDPEARVALAAAVELAWIDSPLGAALLEQAVASLPPGRPSPYRDALRRVRALRELPPATGAVRVFVPAERMATLALERAYCGQRLGVWRDGGRVAELRVIKRFTGRDVVLAELVGPGASAPEAKDLVREE